MGIYRVGFYDKSTVDVEADRIIFRNLIHNHTSNIRFITSVRNSLGEVNDLITGYYNIQDLEEITHLDSDQAKEIQYCEEPIIWVIMVSGVKVVRSYFDSVERSEFRDISKNSRDRFYKFESSKDIDVLYEKIVFKAPSTSIKYIVDVENIVT